METPELESRGLDGIAPPGARYFSMALATTMTLASIAWALDINLYLKLDLYPAQFIAFIWMLSLPLVFVALPARRRRQRDHVPWYDWAAAAAGFLAVGYLTWEYQRLAELILSRPRDAVTAGVIAIVLSLEGLRRTTGNTLPIISIVFILYALFGSYLPGRLAAQPNDLGRLTGYLSLDVNGILGLPLAVASTIVFTFLYFGALLNVSGGSRFFTDIAMLSMGRYRGGPAKIAVIGSSLFGSVSGSAVANVAATGVITIPMITRGGYPAHKAAAIEAVASTGGQLMPPVMGATAFIMAEFLQISYSEVVLAALVPALLYYVALFIQADLEAARLGLAGVPKEEMPEKAPTFKGLHFVLPFVVLIVALFTFNQTPQLAALLAAGVLMVTSLIFGYRGKRPDWRAFFTSLYQAGFTVLDIIMVCVAAGIVIGVLGFSGASFKLPMELVRIGEGSLPILLILSAIVCIVLGMGLPTLGVYVLLAALVAPALVKVGVEPIAAHLYVMYFGMMSMITPPVAIAAFAAAALANSDPMRTGWAAVRFGWMAYLVPILFVLSPALLLIGKTGEIVLAVSTAIIGVWLVSIALSGFFMRALNAGQRALFAIAGLLALIPAGAFPGAGLTDILGAVVGLALLAYEYYATRRAPVSGPG